MDTRNDIPLNPENVEFLLPPYIFYELFPERIPPEENQSQSDSGIVVNGSSDGITVQAANSTDEPSTRVAFNYEGFERKVEHALPIQQTYTWAQIVKGEPSKFNGNLRGTGVFFPQSLVSSMKIQKGKGKGISLNMKAQQTGSEKKKSGKNKREYQKINLFGNEIMQK